MHTLSGKLAKIYQLVGFLFAVWLAWVIGVETFLPVVLRRPQATYASLYTLIIAALVCLLVIVSMCRLVWAKSTRQSNLDAISGIIIILIGIPLTVLVDGNHIALPPQACTYYLAAIGDTTTQLTSADCAIYQSRPLYVIYRNNCASYEKQIGPHNYEQLPPVCVKGFSPAPEPK